MPKRVAVILSGCGFLDGAEIRESVLSLWALDRQDAEVTVFAPQERQHHVVNHFSQEEESVQRNILEESARIARGKIRKLKDLDPKAYDALVLPGGFGVAKNLSDLAFKGAQASMNGVLRECLLAFHQQQKPIAAICIAPAVLCLALGSFSPEVTIGKDGDTVSVIEQLGGRHIPCEVDQIHWDERNKIVSTPAYMFDQARLKDVAKGIEACVNKVLELA